MTELDRRDLLKAACAGCAAVGLAACSAGSSSSADSPAEGATSSPAGDGIIAKLSDIPVGSSISARAPSGPKILLARPAEATVVAFSSVCTHQQCTVEPNGKQLACPCHGSTFDAFTGKNTGGPAPSPLPAFGVRIDGEDVLEA